MPGTGAAAGWYPNPDGMSGFRYWGGASWTAHHRLRPPRQRGGDLLTRTNLSLHECAAGVVVPLTLEVAVLCPTCTGAGTDPSAAPGRCAVCGGNGAEPALGGRTSHLASPVPPHARPCLTCEGHGRVVLTPCPQCRGGARVQERRTIKARIPAGVGQDVRVRLRRQGEAGLGGGEPGDLYVEIDEDKHPRFTRSGADLHCTVRIPAATAMGGGKVAITGIFEDRIIVTIPAGTATGATLTVHGHGMPQLNSDARGNLEIHILVGGPVPQPDIPDSACAHSDAAVGADDSASQRGSWRRGDVVEDLYEVREVITSGGMSLVHRVFHRQWNIELAVKTPNAQHVETAADIRNFEAQAEAWVQLGLHPNVVSCVYVREIDCIPRVFAEWVDGGSLHDAIRSRRLYAGTPDEVLARILDIAIQFAWGLAHAHASGLIHQDVKPANLMLTRDWTAKVSDCGLARARPITGLEHRPTNSGGSVFATFAGMTPAYCSPEQAQAPRLLRASQPAAPLTRATDVWSWAISFWQMFTGSSPVPHGGQLAAEAFADYRRDPWQDDDHIPHMPAPIADLIQGCFDPDPHTRPRDITELASELVDIHTGLIGKTYSRKRPEPAKLLADSLNNHALSMLDLGKPEHAEQLWQQAFETDPHHLHAVYNYGLHRWRKGRITDTEFLYQLDAVAESEPGPHADRLRALVHLERSDIPKARELLTRAATNAPQDRLVTEALTAANEQLPLAEPRLLDSQSRVSSAALSSDGRVALLGNEDGTVQVWDLPGGTWRGTLSAHNGEVVAVATSADGGVAITSSCGARHWADRRPPGDGALRVWDLTRGICCGTLAGEDGSYCLAISADGRIGLSTGSEHSIRVWDLKTGACLDNLTGHTARIAQVAISGDGRLAVSASSDGTLRIWDLPAGTCLRDAVHDADNPREAPSMLEAVTLAADGRLAVSASMDHTLRTWDVAKGVISKTMTGHSGWVEAVAISADGSIAISGSARDDTIRFWNVATGTCRRTLHDLGPIENLRNGALKSVAISADGRVAIALATRSVHVMEVPNVSANTAPWDYARPQNVAQLVDSTVIMAAVREANELLSRGDGIGTATVLQTARGLPGHRRNPELVGLWRRLNSLGRRTELKDAWLQQSLTGHVDSIESLAICADGRIAVSAGLNGAARVWDLAEGTCLRTLAGSSQSDSCVAMSADGRIAVCGGRDGQARVWDLVDGICLRTLAVHPSTLTAVAISTDGQFAVFAGRTPPKMLYPGQPISRGTDAKLEIWDLTSGTRRHSLDKGLTPSGYAPLHGDEIVGVAISADNRTVISLGNGREMHVWDSNSGLLRMSIELGNPQSQDRLFPRALAVANSPTGLIALTGVGNDNARVWDATAATCKAQLAAWSVDTVALSADGQIAMTGGTDGMVRLWDVASGASLGVLGTGATEPINTIAMSADACVAVVGGRDGTVRHWVLDWNYDFVDASRERRTQRNLKHRRVSAHLVLHHAVRTGRGPINRASIEDSVYAGTYLLAIADDSADPGEGGVASRLVLEALADVDNDELEGDLFAKFEEAVRRGNSAIANRVDNDPALGSIATTLTAMLFAGNEVGLIHYGNSRAYLMREGHLVQITRDDTVVQDLVDAGQITAQEASSHPLRSRLTRALSGREFKSTLTVLHARAGDCYLIGTSGLSDLLNPEKMAWLAENRYLRRGFSEIIDLLQMLSPNSGIEAVSFVVAEVVEERSLGN